MTTKGKDMERQLSLFATVEEAEAIAEERSSQARDKAVRLLQYGVREGREARRAGDSFKGPSSKSQ